MRNTTHTWRTWRWSLVAVLGLAGAACEDSAAPPATPGSTADFKSFKPASKGGGGKSASLGGEAASGAAADNKSGQTAAPKVEAGDVAKLDGTTLYILNQWRGLQVVDVANPAAPKLVGKVPMIGQPNEMYVDGKEAIALVNQVAELTDDAGKPVAKSGSVVRRVALGAQPKEVASLAVPGQIAASKRIGDKLVLVVPQVSWNPWWGGCWGPYGCAELAAGGAATDVAVSTKGGASAGGASIAYPGYMGGGYTADTTKVVVLDLATAGKLSLIGEVQVPGGVLAASIEAGEVLIAAQNYVYGNNTGTMHERLAQVALDAAGKPTVGAVHEVKNVWSANSSSSIAQADRIAAGRMAVVRQTWGGSGGYTFVLETWQAAAGAWTKTASISKTNNNGLRLVVEGTQAVLAYSDPVNGSGATDDSGSGGGDPDEGTPVAQKLHLAALDLSSAATIAVASQVSLANGGYDVWGAQIRPLGGGLWLVGHRGTSWSDLQLDVLDLLDAKKPQWAGKLSLKSDYGLQVETLAPDLLAVAVVGGGSKGGTGTGAEPAPGSSATPGVQLISLDIKGGLTKRGLFQSDIVYWYQLKNLLAKKTLYRIHNAALEVVDLADLDKPKKQGGIDLAAEVAEAIIAGGRVVALVQDWQSGTAELRVLKAGSSDELDPDGTLAIQNGYGRLYANGSLVYLSDGSSVRVFDVTDPKAPKARGTWQQPQQTYKAEDNVWWNTYELAQNGAVLYATTTQVKYKVQTGKACESQGMSGGGSTGSAGSTPSSGRATPKQAADGGSSDPGGSGGGSGGTDSADGGSSTPDKPDSPGTDGSYVPTCYTDPAFTTKVVAIDLGNPDAPKTGGSVELKGASWVQNPQMAGSKTLALSHYKQSVGKDGQWFGEYWLDRVDVSNAAQPKLIDTTNVPGYLVGIAADGKSAVTLDWQPKAGSKPEDGKIENVLIAVTLGGGKAKIAKQIALPDQVGATLRHGDAVYVSTWPYWWNWPTAKAGEAPSAPKSQLLVFDAKDPAKLAQATALEAGAGVSYLQADAGVLFAHLGSGLGTTAWNVTAPTQPKFQAFLPTQGYWSPRVLVLDNKAYLPSGWYGVQAFAIAP